VSPLTTLAVVLSAFFALLSPLVPAAVAEPQAELAADDLGIFLDEFFERELPAEQVVGAGVVVVRDGEILAARGYGYADREQKLPVVAETTLFPAQSVSKLFAATAVMQLYERGLVDLDADVRGYLGDVPIDSEYAQPVTLGHLLTHTAGFDDSYIGLLPRDPDDILTVTEFLNRYRRRVIFPPGTVHAYSNYGSLLARHAVEVVTGTSYEEYLVEEIVRPLGMQRTCVLPPPPEWVDRFATGYMPSGEGIESTRDMFPDGLVRFHTHTGTLASTVVDMARFMIAHLEGGGIDGSRILQPETARLMHHQQFAQHPRLPGVAYGFFESVAGGKRGLFHFGSGFGYSTLLYLLPDHRTGFYIAHSNNSSRIAEKFLTAFLERYFDRPRPTVTATLESFDNDATHFAGYYAPVRRPETTFETLPMMLIQGHLRAPDSKTLANDQLLPREWIRTGRDLFERPVGEGLVAFTESATGDPTILSEWDAEAPQLLVLQRLPFSLSTPVLLAQLAGFVLVFVAVVLGYLIGALVRRFRQPSTTRQQRYLHAATFGAAALNLLFLLGLAWTFISQDWMYSVSPTLVATFCIPFVAVALTGLAVAGAIRDRASLSGRPAARTLQLVVLAALVLFPLFLWRWNLLGFHF